MQPLTCHMLPPSAGQKRVMAHLAIPGVTATPQKVYMDASHRQNLHVAVAINKLGGVFFKETSGTSYPGFSPPKTYTDAHGNARTGMAAEEYADFLQAAMKHFSKNPEFRRRREAAMLVHDRSSVHRSGHVATALRSMGLKSVLLPPRSPDLQPLDYGIFGLVKRRVESGLGSDRSWGNRVNLLKKLLADVQPGPTIAQFPKRLEAVVRAGGKHIDNALKEIKDGQKHDVTV